MVRLHIMKHIDQTKQLTVNLLVDPMCPFHMLDEYLLKEILKNCANKLE